MRLIPIMALMAMPAFAPVVRLWVGEGMIAGLEFGDEDGDGDMAGGAVVPKLEDGSAPDEEVGVVIGIDVDDVDVDVRSEGPLWKSG
jgi:hypothetical protein